ncbi:MAG: FAD-dependent 5-carboxymethylaminomethyl-2-thiouridine(34) oxidoreductase MnmC [Pseudomonadota bacterium]|nr:FAD-dependent 5-carboxymethylaminomethyl-2-thiouridine(34) oxidoreductase MnmC [Pseudomonadota bacterium]
MPAPTPAVHWRDDGTPTSLQFGDVYRSSGTDGLGGLAQARQVFLGGCGLLADGDTPAAWADAPRWAVLETGFGLGLNFLATWHAWRQDTARPARLFYSAVEAFVPTPQDLLRSAAPFAELHALAQELAQHWHGLLPGVHRLRLDGERVQLTLAVGDVRPMLAELSSTHDSWFLDGFNPARNPDMWALPTLKAATRLLRHGARAATWCVAAQVRRDLATCGFEVERVPGLPPKRHALRAHYAPRFTPRRRLAPGVPPPVAAPGHCAVVGGGLAGAAVAWSLAARGWQVTVLDTAAHPAAGASGLPAGVVAPHVSPDDKPVSRLTRAGAAATLSRAALLLRAGQDWAATGVLERHAPGQRRLPAAWAALADHAATRAESAPASAVQAQAACAPLNEHHPALWHSRAGWVRPAALVRAMLAAPGITWRGNTPVARIAPHGSGWQLHDGAGTALAQADLVFITAGFGSLALLQSVPQALPAALPLHPLRGQVAFGPMPVADASHGPGGQALPPFPVNGHGSLIAHLPGDDGPWWISGSTFERGTAQPSVQPADHSANRQRLAELLPAAAAALAQQWDTAQAWAGVRATLPDRLPAVGAWAVQDHHQDHDEKRPFALDTKAQLAIKKEVNSPLLPPHLLTGLGARGLTLAVLCGDIAAAWLHGEPLPVAQSLAQRLLAGRWVQTPSAPPT